MSTLTLRTRDGDWIATLRLDQDWSVTTADDAVAVRGIDPADLRTLADELDPCETDLPNTLNAKTVTFEDLNIRKSEPAPADAEAREADWDEYWKKNEHHMIPSISRPAFDAGWDARAAHESYGLTAAEHLEAAQEAGLEVTDEMVKRGQWALNEWHWSATDESLARSILVAALTPPEPRPEWETAPYLWATCTDIGDGHRCIYIRHEEDGVLTWVHNTDWDRIKTWEMELLNPVPVAPEQKED